MKKFKLINEYKGYSNKRDITNIDPRFLVAPSLNVLINDEEKVGPRAGYSLFGTASTSNEPVESSYEWNTSTGTELAIRAYGDELEYYYSGAWRRLADGFSSAAFSFTTFWDTTEKIDFLLFVNGDANMRMWTGAVTTFASATATTITKQGASSWAENRFLKNGTRQVIIGGTTYTYTGGEGTTTLTGVTPDPTVAGHSVGAVVHQAIRTTANSPASGFSNDIVGTSRNQVFVGDYSRRDIYISSNDNYTDFTFTAPVRLPGEGAIPTLDSTPVAFQPQEDVMYIGTRDGWFYTEFQLSADLTAESLNVRRLKASRAKGPLSQQSVAKAGNYVVYVTNDLTVDFLGRVENIDTPESKPLSDIIQNEIRSYDVTIAPHVRYHDSQIFIAFPSQDRVLIYDFEARYWQPPQQLPVRRIAIIGGTLHGHSSRVNESYKLFDETTYSDNGIPVDARVCLAYRNYGPRAWKKVHDEWYSELYKRDGTKVTLTLKYDFGGYTSITNYDIGPILEPRFVFATEADGSLGKWPLGSNPLGSATDAPADMKKVKIIKTTKKVEYYEIQVVYSSNEIDARWELLATGGNVAESTNDNVDIKD